MNRDGAQLKKRRRRIHGLRVAQPQRRSYTISLVVGSLMTRYVHREACNLCIKSLTERDQMNVRTVGGRLNYDLIPDYLDLRTYRDETRRKFSAMGRLSRYAPVDIVISVSISDFRCASESAVWMVSTSALID